MKMAPRLIDLINKKKNKQTNCTCSTLFLLIRKTNLHMQHTFLYFQVAVVLDDYNAGLYD